MRTTFPDPPEPPTGLSDEALALWRGWHDDLLDPDDETHDREPDARETAILAEACRHLTIASRLEAVLAEMDDLVVPGSRGNMRVTPVVGEIDKVRKTVTSLLSSIKPPADRSAIGRRNGGVRWGKE